MVDRKRFKNNWEWIKAMMNRNRKSILEYRKSLFVEVFGMVINNAAFIFVWYFVFQEYGSINGWGFQELFLLNSFVAMVYGITHVFVKGTSEISRNVTMGQLDQYITQPKNVLLNLMYSEVSASALGDILEGGLSFIIYIFISSSSILNILIFIPIMILAILVWIGFLISIQSIVFWLPNSEGLSSTLLNITLGTSLYPNKALVGLPRMFFTFVLPATLLGTVPADIVLNPNWSQVLILVGMAIFWMLFGVLLFNRGIKRYESGNVFGGI